MQLIDRLKAATGPDRELDAEIMFDLFATPVGERKDGGPVGYLWPEDNPSWNFGLRFPDSSKEQILANRKHVDGETLIIERDGANVLMNSIRIPLVTASLDAAIALVERMLPEHCNSSIKTGKNEFAAYIWNPSGSLAHHEAEGCPSRPIAILIALFTALHGKDKL